MRILHVFRSPVGGLFRHVCDVARGQHASGHEVGIFCDSTSGGALALSKLDELRKFCTLGITVAPIARLPGIDDFRNVSSVIKFAKQHKYDVVHGHGAKGGLIARIAAKRLAIPSVYTPHGGSLHFSWASISGLAFLTAEKILTQFSSGFVFVCEFERAAFQQKIGLGSRSSIVINNALWPEEFVSQKLNSNAADLLFVGEVRHLKGIDVLLKALVHLQPQQRYSLSVVGDGPELEQYRKMTVALGLADQVNFAGRLPISEALRTGRVMVVPSRHESFPYVVLEAIAGQTPIIATNVGGIPEVLPVNMMVLPDSVEALAEKIKAVFENINPYEAATLKLSLNMKSHATAQKMADGIAQFYRTLS